MNPKIHPDLLRDKIGNLHSDAVLATPEYRKLNEVNIQVKAARKKLCHTKKEEDGIELCCTDRLKEFNSGREEGRMIQLWKLFFKALRT